MIRDLDSLFGYSTYNYTLYTLTARCNVFDRVLLPPRKCHRIREFQEEEIPANLFNELAVLCRHLGAALVIRAGGCALLAFSRRVPCSFCTAWNNHAIYGAQSLYSKPGLLV